MDRPNLLFVTTDHLRRDVAGMSSVAPNLNALADRGVEFANAYCPAPLCMPSRNCLATGQYPSRHGVCGNVNEPLDDGENPHNDDRFTRHLDDPGERQRYRRLLEEGADCPFEPEHVADGYIGELIDALDGRDARSETLIVVTSDHGDMLGDHGIFDKRHFHEPSVGVPLVMAGAGVETGEVSERQGGGLVRKELVNLVDLYPTFLVAAGVEYVHGDGRRSGHSLFPVIDGSIRDRRDARRRLTERLCSRLIRQSSRTHEKEQMRVQEVRV
jgi:arylsulfatase A-like enzyme